MRAVPTARKFFLPGSKTVWLNPQRTRIHFIDSEIDEALRVELDALDVTKPMVLADKAGSLAPIFEELVIGGCGFAPGEMARMSALHLIETQTNPDDVRAVFRRFTRDGHDCLVVIGGRHAIDAAKLALRDVMRHRTKDGRLSPARAHVPLVIIPTSPADGAGLRRWTRVRHADGNFKSVQDEAFRPDVLICDARLEGGIDPQEAICAEFDVFLHCVETLVRPRLSPPAKGLALDCMRQTWRQLRQQPAHDAEHAQPVFAPSRQFPRAVNAALAEEGGLGAAHAIALGVEEACRTAPDHGCFHAAILGPVLRFNAPAIPAAIEEIEDVMGCTGGATGIATMLVDKARQVSLPASLAALNLTDCKIARLARSIAEDPGGMTNPRRVRQEDYEAILREIS